MTAPVDPLQRVLQMLVEVLALTDRVVAQRASWRASSEDSDFLSEVASLTSQTDPEEASKSATKALSFLLFARFTLETKARLLGNSDDWPLVDKP